MFLLTILIPIIILGTFSFSIIYNYIQSNSLKKAEQPIEQLNQSMELISDDIITLSEYFSIDASPSMNLKRILQSDRVSYGGALKLTMFNDILDSMINFREYIDSIYIYFPNDKNLFLSSHYGVATTDSFSDQSWLDRTLALSQNSTDLFDAGVRYVKQGYPPVDTPIISLYQKPFSIHYSKNDGVIVLNLKYRYIENMLNQLTSLKSQELYIFNKKNELIAKSASSPPLSEEIMHLLSVSHHTTYTLSENRNTISLLDSSRYGFIYVSVTPTRDLYAVPRYLFCFILCLILASLLLAFTLAYRYSKNTYSSINHIINIIDAAKKGSPFPESQIQKNDEFNYIITNLLENFLKQDYLKIQLSEKNYRAQALELIALQSQINPHFLSNTLETIYLKGLALTRTPNDVTYLVENLSDIMHYSLTNPTSTVRFEEDLQYTRCYLNIQQFRYKDKFRLIWDCESAVNNIYVMKLLLQPFIENSIYHGIKEKGGNGVIKICCFLRNDSLHIHIVDNGIGIRTEKLKELRQNLDSGKETYQHIGLTNTYKRLKILYGDKLYFSIRSKYLSGTAISLIVPAVLSDSFSAITKHKAHE